MAIKEFPDIQVELKCKGSKNPFYVGALGVPAVGPSVPLAHALAAGVENTNKFLGATIDVYADGGRQASQERRQISDDEFLGTLIREFAEDGWIYGIVLNESQPNRIERLLRTRTEMQEFLQGDGLKYHPQRLARTVFVPTEQFTNKVWGFDYEPKNLERMVDFQ